MAARIGFEPNTATLIFEDENGDPIDISGEDFKLGVKRRSADTDYLFTLEIGSGLEVTGADSNQLEVTPSLAQTQQREETHFGIIWSGDSGKAWFTFPFYFHTGIFAGFDDEDSTTTITVTTGTDPYAVRDMGAWDASGDLFPETGGSGAGGTVKAFNEFDISVSGNLKDQDENTILVPAGSTIRALVDNPGQTGANWRIYF